MKKCIKCNASLKDSDLFCEQCGTPQAENKKCSKCRALLEKDFAFCPHCGQKIKQMTKAELKESEQVLHQSYIEGMKSTLKRFMDNGLDLDDDGISSEPLLCIACREKDFDIDIIEALLLAGADVDVVGNYDDTPLLIACEKNDNQLIRLLLSYNPDCECSNSSSDTPLSLARANNNRYVVGLLRKQGVDISKDDDDDDDYSSSSGGWWKWLRN